MVLSCKSSIKSICFEICQVTVKQIQNRNDQLKFYLHVWSRIYGVFSRQHAVKYVRFKVPGSVTVVPRHLKPIQCTPRLHIVYPPAFAILGYTMAAPPGAPFQSSVLDETQITKTTNLFETFKCSINFYLPLRLSIVL